jgi:hypothetical protein
MSAQEYGPPPGYHTPEPFRAPPQFRSTLGNDAQIDPQAIATAIRAVMNGVRVTDQAIAKLEGSQVSAADLLLGRVEALIDFGALDRATEGVSRLEALLGSDGVVVFECSDHAVSSLREQVDAAAQALAPYQKLRGKTP